MADFAERISDGRAGRRLARAIDGRGAFRRFKAEPISVWYDDFRLHATIPTLPALADERTLASNCREHSHWRRSVAGLWCDYVV